MTNITLFPVSAQKALTAILQHNFFFDARKKIISDDKKSKMKNGKSENDVKSAMTGLVVNDGKDK